MLRQLAALYAQYRQAHRRLQAPGFSLHDDTGATIGYVDRILIEGDRVVFEGWSLARRVGLHNRDGLVTDVPRLLRQDVAQAMGCTPFVGFRLSRPVVDGRYTLVSDMGDKSFDIHIAPFPKSVTRRNTLRLMAGFAGKLGRLLPTFVAWALWHPESARARVKQVLGLHRAPQAAPMSPHLFTPFTDPDPRPQEGVTLVMPIYNAFDLLAEALDRVARYTDVPWHLVLIEDGSSDARVRPWLRDWVADTGPKIPGAAPGTIELIENPDNLGFIGAVNRGLAVAVGRGHHVVLLNSDAFVPAGWASRLLRPLDAHDTVASVTPMSNDAEIFSVPAICTRSPLAPGQVDALNTCAQGFNPDDSLSEAPTGVGFCMAMHIDFLRQIPELDTVFGRGYGEEVDWCQKARALGGRHLGAGNVFVEHRGGESFGTEAKAALVHANNAIVSRRYPGYDTEVQQFIATDPLIAPRMGLAIAWAAEAAAGAPVPVYLAHSMGGGAEKYLQTRITAALKDDDCPALVLRVGGTHRWQLEVVSAQGLCAGHTDDFDLITALLDILPRRRIVYSCGVGDPDPITLPAHLLALLRPDRGDRLEVLVHDFFMISPGYTLLDSAGHIRAADALDPDDPAHQSRTPDGTLQSLTQWQAAWGALMEAADRIVIFSHDSGTHIRAAYPKVAGALTLRPHEVKTDVPRLSRPEGPKRVIAVLGNINIHKGLLVACDLARRAETLRDVEIIVIGQTDPSIPLPDALRVHGPYEMSDMAGIAARYGITDWLIPSIWPETFSYTTHEALATGLPTYAFALGAQGDAVAAAPHGHAVPFDPTGTPAAALLEAMGLTEATPSFEKDIA